MNDLVKAGNFGAPSKVFANAPKQDDLGAGIAGGYGMIGYKGKVWSIRYKGEEHKLMRDDGDGPRGSVELVVIKASQHLGKVWYEAGYAEGSKAAPDCFSSNGVTPDPTSPKKQSTVCATCPKNAFGSAMKQDGTPGKGKACSDHKRLAVTSLHDVDNEMFGGPMLLRVPASSLNALATYGKGVQKLGFPYYGVGTRVAFDTQDAYPKFVFSPIRPLNDEEAAKVMALMNDPQVDRILAEDVFDATPVATKQDEPTMAFEQPQTTASTPAPAETKPARRAAKPPAQPAAKAPAEKPAPAPAAKPSGFGPVAATPAAAPAGVQVADTAAFDDALDDELARLMGQ